MADDARRTAMVSAAVYSLTTMLQQLPTPLAAQPEDIVFGLSDAACRACLAFHAQDILEARTAALVAISTWFDTVAPRIPGVHPERKPS